eukprot:4430886-Prymnesium_polylepis.1
MGMEVGVPDVPGNFYHAGRCAEAVQKGMGRVGTARYRASSSTGARTALSGTDAVREANSSKSPTCFTLKIPWCPPGCHSHRRCGKRWV